MIGDVTGEDLDAMNVPDSDDLLKLTRWLISEPENAAQCRLAALTMAAVLNREPHPADLDRWPPGVSVAAQLSRWAPSECTETAPAATPRRSARDQGRWPFSPHPDLVARSADNAALNGLFRAVRTWRERRTLPDADHRISAARGLALAAVALAELTHPDPVGTPPQETIRAVREIAAAAADVLVAMGDVLDTLSAAVRAQPATFAAPNYDRARYLANLYRHAATAIDDATRATRVTDVLHLEPIAEVDPDL